MQTEMMVSVSSRTGRQFQRYNQGCRQVVGCIPYRYRKPYGSPSIKGELVEELEILLVSSQKSAKLMFPKGGWEIDESMEEAALRESMEEAGVSGAVGASLGQWSFKSNSQDAFHEGHMFPLLVTEEFDVWPEKNVRQRIWMSVSEARKSCVHQWMKEALDVFVVHLQRKKEESAEELSSAVDREEEEGPCTSITVGGYPMSEKPTSCNRIAEEDVQMTSSFQPNSKESLTIVSVGFLRTEEPSRARTVDELLKTRSSGLFIRKDAASWMTCSLRFLNLQGGKSWTAYFSLECLRSEESRLAIASQTGKKLIVNFLNFFDPNL